MRFLPLRCSSALHRQAWFGDELDGERTPQLRAAFAGLEASARSIGPDRLLTRLGRVQKSGDFTVVATTGDPAHQRRVHEDGSEESVSVELTAECERVFGASVDAVTFVRR